MSRKKCPNPREMVLGAGGLILAGALHALKFTRGCPALLMYIYGRLDSIVENCYPEAVRLLEEEKRKKGKGGGDGRG